MCLLVIAAVIAVVILFLLTTTGMIWTGFGLVWTFVVSLSEERRRRRGWLSAIWHAGPVGLWHLVVEARDSMVHLWALPAWLLAVVASLAAVLAHGLLWPVEPLNSGRLRPARAKSR